MTSLLFGISPLDPSYSNADDGDYYHRALRLALTGQYIDDNWLIRPPLHVFCYAFWLWLAIATGRPALGVPFIQLAQTGLAALTAVLVGFVGPLFNGLFLSGISMERAALVLHFAAAKQPLDASLVLGTRVLSNMDLRSLVGAPQANEAITVRKSINVNAPPRHRIDLQVMGPFSSDDRIPRQLRFEV